MTKKLCTLCTLQLASTPSIRIRIRTRLDYKKISLLSLSLQLPNTILIFNFNMMATATTRGTVVGVVWEMGCVGGTYIIRNGIKTEYVRFSVLGQFNIVTLGRMMGKCDI